MNPTPETIDFDQIMKTNLLHVFGEHDPEKRLQALDALYTPDAKLVDPEGIAQGHAEISDQVAALHKMLPEGLAFTPKGTAIGHHNAGRLHWELARPGEAPILTGLDVALFQDGKIATLYVFVDPKN